jgi:predicted nucleotidyltransferase
MSIDYRHPIRDIVTGARGKILEAIIRTDKTYPVRQWARRAGVSHVQAGKLLQEFADLGIVNQEQRGRNLEYTPNRNSLLHGHLSELDMIATDLIPKARDLLHAPADSIIGVFGSVARDALHPGSDLDVFVIHEEAGPWIDAWRAEVEEAIEIPVNVLTFTPEEWGAAEDNAEGIVTEIQSDAIMLHGSLP